MCYWRKIDVYIILYRQLHVKLLSPDVGSSDED